MSTVPTVAEPSRLLSAGRLRSISQINALPEEERTRVYQCLLPLDVMLRFDINLERASDDSESSLFTVAPQRTSVALSLRHVPEAEDPLLYLQLADTALGQIGVVMFIVNDPESDRFDTDQLPDGTLTHFGTVRRNIEEEIRAMEAGLAPGQVRRGLRLTRDLMPGLEAFVDHLDHDTFFIEPLAYHNAVLFERMGFAYVMGLGRMKWIHREFAPGGLLYNRLDGSTPFRRPGAHETVRGRSWAVHDGIMGTPFEGVKMHKQVGIHAGVVTFPEAPW